MFCLTPYHHYLPVPYRSISINLGVYILHNDISTNVCPYIHVPHHVISTNVCPFVPHLVISINVSLLNVILSNQ